MFSVKPLVCQKMCSLFGVQWIDCAVVYGRKRVLYLSLTSPPELLWVLDIWGHIQSRSPSPELSCFLSSLLLYRLPLPQWTLWAALSDSLHRDRDSWLCEVAVGRVSGLWLRCCSCWVWDGCEIQRVGSITSALQAVPWEPGAVTAVPWSHGRGPSPPLDLWPKGLLCYVFWEYEQDSNLQSKFEHVQK